MRDTKQRLRTSLGRCTPLFMRNLFHVSLQSQKMLDERQAKMKVKEVQKQEKEKRLQKLKSQVEVNVSRDPSRLYKLTAGWEQRKKEGPGTAGHGPSLHMPHRAVPSWRQGLS